MEASAMATVTLPRPVRQIRSRKRGIGYKARQVRREWSAYAFLAPGLIIFSVFTLFALIYAFYLTFHEWDIIQPAKPFVGLQNYRDMLHDSQYRTAIFNTAYFTAGSVPVTMAIGLCIALLLNQPLRFRGLFRTMYYLPVVTPFVVQAIVWKWLYDPNYGLFDFYLQKLHLIHNPLLFLSSQNLAMPSVIVMSIWGGVGFSMVVYLAGLQAIPEELYEAAKIDGAGTFARLRFITVPMLAPTSLFLLVIGIIGSFGIFTQIFVMTSGGPGTRTTTIVYYIYQQAFTYYHMGYASTLGYGLFVLLFVVTLLQLQLYRRADA
jgi:multiple sugar transport system permease protein